MNCKLNIFPQRQLGDMKQSSQLRIQQREKDAQDLRHAIFSLTVSVIHQFDLMYKSCYQFIMLFYHQTLSTATLYNTLSKQQIVVSIYCLNFLRNSLLCVSL